jgi:hypothetical protein
LRALLILAGCFAPDYHNGAFLCSASGRCPEGFHCAADQTCWRDGQDPNLPDGGGSDASGDGGVRDLAEPLLPDIRPPEGGWVVQASIVTVGSNGANGPLRLSGDGLEYNDVSCNSTLCVVGGISP